MQEFVQGCYEELWQAIAAGYDPADLDLLRDYKLIIHGALPTNPDTIPAVVFAILKGLKRKSGSCERMRFHLDQLKLATQDSAEFFHPHGALNLDILSQSASILSAE